MRRLETYAHPLSDFPRNLASDLRNDGCGLTQLGSFKTCIANLTCGVNLAHIDSPICIQFFVVVLLHSATRLGSSTPVAANRFTCARIDSSNLLTGLPFDRDFHIYLVLLAAGD